MQLKKEFLATGLLVTASIFGPLAGLANAIPVSSKPTPTTTSTNDKQLLSNIIAKGNKEIARRVSALNSVLVKITSDTRLSASDKTTLTNQVKTELSNLETLRTKLDAETTVAGARADVQSIVNEYRVFSLVFPKIWLIRTADDQMVSEARLATLITKFQTRLNAAKSKGKNVAAIQETLSDMQTKVANAQAISSSVQQKVIALQPSDFNTDHAILNGDQAQLKDAHADIQAAMADAQTIIKGIRSL